MSARGEYRPPTFPPPAPQGLQDLARSLQDLLAQVSDPYELAAHLEVLGYNRYRVERLFDLPSTFALAQALFALAQRDFRPRAKAPRPRGGLGLRHLAVALTLLGTLVAFQGAGEVGWLPALFLLAWSQLAARGALKAAVELAPGEVPSVHTAFAWLGVVGASLTAPWDLGPAASWSVGVAWVAVGVLTLKGLEGKATGVAAAFLSGAIALRLVGASPLWVGLLPLAFLLWDVGMPKPHGLLFVHSAFQTEWIYAAYGLGQGLVLWRLVEGAGQGALLGLAAYLLAALLIEMRLAAFVQALGETLWQKASPEALLLSIQRAFWTYAFTASVPAMLLLLALPWSDAYGKALLGFGFLGFTSAVALGLNALGGIRASALALLASALLLHLTGDPLILGAVGLSLLLYFLEYLRHPERYGVYLL
ncbi:hypothetical protein TJA_19040 [Thermus sp. LT1-2-5]|uniref:hypothetical protein n=1 Tax=Thermus sp. LT1-2-5 TaxID=3026935 RepID=UPI0030E995E5